MMRAFGRLSIVVAVLLAALMIHVGQPGSPWWWGASIPFALWVIGGAVAPYLFARRSRDAGLVGAMFALFLLENALAGAAYVKAFFFSASSTAALVLIYAPLYQWTALLLVGGGQALARRISNARRREQLNA